DYKLKLLFESWDIQEKWQFALSWFTVVLAVVVYHALRYCIVMVEKNIVGYRTSQKNSDKDTTSLTSPFSFSDSTMLKHRFVHSFLSALNYGVTLTIPFLIHNISK
ncbi:copper transporter family protein, partial [archaeon]